MHAILKTSRTLRLSLALFTVLGMGAASSSASAGDSGTLSNIGEDGPVIVGMWREQFFVDGNQIDFGYAQWHADGTEFLNSGTLNPSGQNFCLGVWQRTGRSTYHLNHFAFGYVPQIQNADGSPAIHASPALNVNIREDVRLDVKGSSYSGTFTIDFYDFTTNALVNHVAGKVTGQRITAY